MKPLLAGLILLICGCGRVREAMPLAPVPAAPPAIATPANDESNEARAEEPGEEQDAIKAREYFLSRRLPEGETELPLNRYLAAREHIARMPQFSFREGGIAAGAHATGSNAWTELGPGNLGGRTRSLVIDKNNPSVMYAGSVTGGVFKTTDGGQNWTALTDILPVLNVGALVMDPNDSNTLYAGTGESYQSWFGAGIFKTTDGGATWKQLPQTASIVYTNKLVTSPSNAGRIYAATNLGIYTSADAGATWKVMNLNTAQASSGCQDLVIRTDGSTDYLFASCSPKPGTTDYAIWRNTDAAGSGTWTQVFTAPHMARTSLAIAPSQQTTIYAMANSVGGDPHYQNGLLAVYRSDASGDPGSWNPRVTNADPNVMNTLLLTDARTVIATGLNSFCNAGGAPTYAAGQGWYDNVLAVDPADPERVWAGGVEVFRSDDGGMNWGVASLWQIPIGTPMYAHADRHVIVFAPGYDGSSNQTMFLGTDGGLFRTDNARAAVSTGPRAACPTDFQNNNQVLWNDLNHSYTAYQFYHGAAYPGGGMYLGGAQDNSVGRGSDLSGLNGWLPFSTGDGTSVAVDPADVNMFYESKQLLSLARSVNGVSTLGATSGITEPGSGFPFVPFLAMDPGDGRRLYLGGSVSLWRSVNGAVSWSAAAPVEVASAVSSIAVSPFDSKTVLFGTVRGFIYFNHDALNADGSTAWSYARPRTGNVASIAFDPVNPDTVYATYTTFKSALSPNDAHIYKSLNGGATWFSIDGSGASAFPDIPAHRILVDPRNPQTIYVGSDLGVFVSTDGGVTWAHDPNEFGNVITEELAFDPSNSWLFAFTYGRSAFRIPLPGSNAANCTYTVSPTTIQAAPPGGVYAVNIDAPPGCAWSGLPGSLPAAFTVQSPATGTGKSQAFIAVQSVNGDNPRSDVVNIANTAVQINQSGADVSGSAAPTDPPSVNIPGGIGINNQKGGAPAAADPIHSCTGSKDFKTDWWSVTPNFTGTLQIRAFSQRTDIFGNAGLVLTVYPANQLGTELACVQVARDTAPEHDAIITISVTAGSSFWIETSALGSAASDGGNVFMYVAQFVATALAVSPQSANLAAGSSPQQFSAQVSGAPNPAVRWTINPQIGVISPAGVYSPPASLDNPVTVAVTATAFGDKTTTAGATINLTPAGAGPPVITEVASATGEIPIISQNTYIQIKGQNLAGNTRIWQDSDFVNNQMPTSLDGTSVTVNGKPAYVYFISSKQVNVLTPFDASTGPLQVELTYQGQKADFTIPAQQLAPGFFSFEGVHPAAAHLDGTFIGSATLFPGLTTPAAPGETIVLFGNGFGQTNPAIVPGSATASGTLPTLPVIRIGGIQAHVSFAGIVGPGLYQFNVVVPPGLGNGDVTLVAAYNGFNTQPGLMLTIQN